MGLTKAVKTHSNMTYLLLKKQPPMKASLGAVFIFILAIVSPQVFAQDTLEGQDSPNPSAIEVESAAQNLDLASQDALSGENDFDVLSAHAWMRRLSNTVNQMSFEISFVVSSPGRETLPYLWRHALLDNGDKAEQLSLLNGPGFEQIRINNKVSIFEPGFAPLSIRANVIDGPIPGAFIHHPEILNDSYDVLLMGRNRVLGRMAQQVRIISKDKTRYQYHVWLDEQTGLLLKQNMYDDKGGLLEQIQVTHLAINADVAEYFVNITPSQLPPVAATQVQRDQNLPWVLSFMPVGMQKVSENLRRISLTGQPAEYMMVSDGLVDVSIYVMKATEATQEDLAITTDSTSIVSMSDGRIQVTVVGEIPLETATKMANSIIVKDLPK